MTNKIFKELIYMLLQNWKINRILVITFLCILLLPIPALVQASTETILEKGAKTPPPPQEMTIQGSFNPNHKYLEDGYNTITNKGNGRVELWGKTTASQHVHTIGVRFYLERWTGSSWVNVDSRIGSYTDNNYKTVEAYESKSVEPGYYYRVRTVHWVHEGVYCIIELPGIAK